MAEKHHGGDWFDKIQEYYRNVALDIMESVSKC